MHVKHALRFLCLHSSHYCVASAPTASHRCRIAPKRVHAWLIRSRAVRAIRAHSIAVKGRENYLDCNEERLHATEGVTRCEQSAQIVGRKLIGQRYLDSGGFVLRLTWRPQARSIVVDVRQEFARCACERGIVSAASEEAHSQSRVSLAGCHRAENWVPIYDAAAKNDVPNRTSHLPRPREPTRHELIVF